MNNYVDYNYYTETFKGTLIPNQEFDKYATMASGRIRNNIHSRDITYFEKEVKTATCCVAEIFYNQYLNKEKLKNISSGTEKIVTSEQVGDYSRNISNLSIQDLLKIISDEEVDKEIVAVLEDYLLSTGLLYCGGF